jgi:hypothetical protein
MPAGNVPGLVRQHADDLIRRLRFHQRARIHEDALAVHDEGVEVAVVDDHDLDVVAGQAGDLQDRRGVVAQQLLDLGVADDRHAALRRCLLRQACRGDGGGGQNRDGAGRWPKAARPDRGFHGCHVAEYGPFGAT